MNETYILLSGNKTFGPSNTGAPYNAEMGGSINGYKNSAYVFDKDFKFLRYIKMNGHTTAPTTSNYDTSTDLIINGGTQILKIWNKNQHGPYSSIYVQYFYQEIYDIDLHSIH